MRYIFATCLLAVVTVPVQAQNPVDYAHAMAAIQSSSVQATKQASNPLGREIAIDVREKPIAEALREIQAKSGTQLVYAREDFASDKRITLRADRIEVGNALKQVLAGTNVAVQLTSNGVITLVRQKSQSTQGIIIGRVIDGKTKRPLVGATVTLDDATKGVATGEDGSFRLSAAVGERTVHVRAVGFVRGSVRVTVVADQSVSATVTLEPSANVLDEIVVTGSIVATERKTIPTPITVLTAADLEQRGITRVEQLFRGDIPGIIALETGSQTYNIGAADSLGTMVSSKVYARGTASLDGASNPLKTFVDGVELLDASYLGTIDPKNIERIEIITGPQATTLYGAGAMGGVMQIFTKRGAGMDAPEFTLNLNMGMLENSLSNGRTPSHNHSLGVQGGSGPALSYAGTVSYNYTGQWQPSLFNRGYNGTLGLTHIQGPFSVSGSVGVGQGRSGAGIVAPLNRILRATGEYDVNSQVGRVTNRVTTWGSQLLSLNVDYRVSPNWQHQLTFGRDQKNFTLEPVAPEVRLISDTLFKHARSEGERTSINYHTTIIMPQFGRTTATLLLGGSGTVASQTDVRGCTATKTSTTFIDCAPGAVRVTKPRDDKSSGGFGSLRLGLFDQVYATVGIRGETNPAYGREHKIDWTPTTGLTYTFEYNDLSVKLLTSYGSATRSPLPDQRKETPAYMNNYTPGEYTSNYANPYLTPQYSRGPQGGIEVYYGSLGSFTLNLYRQKVTDLIQRVKVDSVLMTSLANGSTLWIGEHQYQNVGNILQRGIEATGRVNAGPLSVSGVYSWFDSRVTHVHEQGLGVYAFYKGMSFLNIPTHTGNVTFGYSHGRTSLSFITRFVSQTTQLGNESPFDWETRVARIKTYASRARGLGALQWRTAGYAKSDLLMAHQMTRWASLRINIMNVGNDYGQDTDAYWPVLGRQTTLGLSLKFPQR